MLQGYVSGLKLSEFRAVWLYLQAYGGALFKNPASDLLTHSPDPWSRSLDKLCELTV